MAVIVVARLGLETERRDGHHTTVDAFYALR